ncbi:MAG: prolipoprotein diacylglyceryl transferase [Chloroflexi bacterium]|nr:prolipoprotein diacylglyceryl transferase [Chloroflexota bacterium]
MLRSITINVDPIILHVGPFGLHWYTLAVTGGIVVAIWLALRESRRKGLNQDKMMSLAIWSVLVGLIGARLFHVVDKLSYYLENPAQILAVYQGGLAIWGGILVGGLTGIIYAWRVGLPIARTADVAAVSILAGQMIGRLGCIVNGDAYGGPTSLPWAFVYVNPGSLIPPEFFGVPTHPYPLYEILWDAALFAGLWAWRKQPKSDGLLFLTYASVYALGRFTLTFVRREDITLLGLQQAQVISLIVLIVALSAIVALTLKTQRVQAPAPRSR